MHRRTLALVLAHLTACAGNGGDGTDPATSTTASTTQTTGGTSSDPVTTTATTGLGTTDATDTTAPGTSSGEPPTTGETTTVGDDSTTGEPAFCNGWQGAEGEPYLNFYTVDKVLLANGGTLPLECGAQGLFMFALYGEFGGFTPTSNVVDFAITVDVEGFNKNPEGHFYSAAPVGYYVSCEQTDGGLGGFVPIFPFDNLDDLTMLDGKPASIHVVMNTDEGNVTVDYEVVLSVKKDDSWAICGG